MKVIFLQLNPSWNHKCQLFWSSILRRQSVNVLYIYSFPETLGHAVSTKRDTKQSWVKGIQVFFKYR